MEEQLSSSQTLRQDSQISSHGKPQSFLQLPEYPEDLQIQALIELRKDIFVVRQRKKRERANENELKSMQSRILGYCRKQKSLESLSAKFIDQFEGKANRLIELDKVTKDLNVERRRMYDIINILESLNVVVKNGKNNYLWKGLSEAVKTIERCQENQGQQKAECSKKEKSLQYFAAGFLKLLIHTKPAISLQQATLILMRDKNQGEIKTKIRRLYDIINIFKSLGIVRKTSVAVKKANFQFAGLKKLLGIIIQKNDPARMKKLQEIKIQEKHEFDSKVTCVQKSPVFPFASKESLCSSLSNFQFQLPIGIKHQIQIQDRTNDNKYKFDLFGGFSKFNQGFSAFKLVNNDRR